MDSHPKAESVCFIAVFFNGVKYCGNKQKIILKSQAFVIKRHFHMEDLTGLFIQMKQGAHRQTRAVKSNTPLKT